MTRRFDASHEEMNRRFNATADLIQQVAFRLEAHIDQGCADLKARFDRQEARMERHGGLSETTRLIEWNENAMEERMRRLEEKR